MSALNTRQKYERLENPHTEDTSLIVSDVSASAFFASIRRVFKMYSIGASPIAALNFRQKWYLLTCKSRQSMSRVSVREMFSLMQAIALVIKSDIGAACPTAYRSRSISRFT